MERTTICLPRGSPQKMPLTKHIAKEMFKVTAGKRLLEEDEWRKLGVTQSRGWGHYEIHRPEPHILLFRRALGTDPNTGKPK
mmetsp:Transcript_94498/g.266932  ORF Transcript_94498/g.266932 Transcript_94498/m.266932 type:complete len:82 (-) Transcript_94498:131-376(-)